MSRLSILKSFSVVSLVIISVAIQAQSFHYDTVPNPNKNQRQLFRYETQNRQPAVTKQREATPPPSQKQSGFDKSKLIFGGSLGLSFGNYTCLNIAPQIGYQFNKYFAAGAGVSYSYYSFDDWSQNYLGFNLYAQVNPIQYIALRVQPEIYSMWASDRHGNSVSETVPCLLVGGGAILPVSAKGSVCMMLYYDLAQNKYSPYYNQLVYSVGYIFSF